MQANRIPPEDEGGELSEVAREDARWQGRVLSLVLSEDPLELSEREALAALLSAEASWEERDGLERAIKELKAAGLLRDCPSLLLPTRAARHFASLELD